MSPADDPSPPPAQPSKATPPVRASTSAGPSTTRRTWVAAVSAGIVAGLAAWAGGEAALDRFSPSTKAAAEPYEFKALNAELYVADQKNAALAFGCLGGFLGLALGLAGGIARRSAAGGLMAGAIGLVLGGAAGAAASYPLAPIFRVNFDPATPNLIMPLLIHGGIWAAIGAAAGLAFGLGLGQRGRAGLTLVGGLVGAVLATGLFEILGALVMPAGGTDQPIAPTVGPRFVARLLVAVFVALGAAWAAQPATGKPRDTPHKGLD